MIIAKQPIDYISLKNTFIIAGAKIKDKYKEEWYTQDSQSLKTYEQKFYYYLQDGIYRLERLLNEHPEYQIVGAEVPIDFKYNGDKRFTGSIDRLIYDTVNKSYLIQDIKSWPTIEKHKDDLPTPLQFVVYSLALAEMKNCDVSKIKCQYDLPLADGIYDAGTKGFIARGTKKLDELFEGVYSFDWTPSPKPLCAWCEFSTTNPDAPKEGRGLCPYHSIWDRETRVSDEMYIPANRWIDEAHHSLIAERYAESLEKFNKEVN